MDVAEEEVEDEVDDPNTEHVDPILLVSLKLSDSVPTVTSNLAEDA